MSYDNFIQVAIPRITELRWQAVLPQRVGDHRIHGDDVSKAPRMASRLISLSLQAVGPQLSTARPCGDKPQNRQRSIFWLSAVDNEPGSSWPCSFRDPSLAREAAPTHSTSREIVAMHLRTSHWVCLSSIPRTGFGRMGSVSCI